MLCEDGNAVQEARHQLKIHCTKVFHKNDTVTCISRESNDGCSVVQGASISSESIVLRLFQLQSLGMDDMASPGIMFTQVCSTGLLCIPCKCSLQQVMMHQHQGQRWSLHYRSLRGCQRGCRRCSCIASLCAFRSLSRQKLLCKLQSHPA